MNLPILVVVLISIIFSPCILSKIILEDSVYTNDFAVAIEGTEADVKRFAEKEGFIYLKKVISNYYLFRKASLSSKSLKESGVHLAQLRKKPEVIDVQQQIGKRRVIKQATDTEWNQMWFLNGDVKPTTGVLKAWDKGYDGKGITLAVVDDGIYENHPDLAENLLTDISYDVLDHDEDVTPVHPLNYSHGTICAGLIAAVKDNGECISGIANKAKVVGVRLIKDHPQFNLDLDIDPELLEIERKITDAEEAMALKHELDKVDIYSNSWGALDDILFSGPSKLAELALKTGVNQGRNGLGAIYVFAAGNGGVDDNCNADGYVNSMYTIAITGLSNDGRPAKYNEYCAPAMAAVYSGDTEKQIVSTDLEDACTGGWNGTSFATPQAAAMIALALQANPSLTWRDVQHLIVQTAKMTSDSKAWKFNGAGYHVSDRMGFGLMNADAMVSKALNWTSVSKQTTCTGPTKFHAERVGEGSSKKVYTTMHCTGVKYLEHVLVKINYTSLSRGETSITLTSPSGTKSKLLTPRKYEKGFEQNWLWTYMSVQFWGENPEGKWWLKVSQGGESYYQGGGSYYMFDDFSINTGMLHSWQLTLYGTSGSPFGQTNDCPNLPSIDNAHVHVSHFGRPARTEVGDRATYTCVEGYIGNGNPEITCKVGGWSDTDFHCTERHTQKPKPVITNGIRHATSTSKPTENKASKSVPYIVVGAIAFSISLIGVALKSALGGKTQPQELTRGRRRLRFITVTAPSNSNTDSLRCANGTVGHPSSPRADVHVMRNENGVDCPDTARLINQDFLS